MHDDEIRPTKGTSRQGPFKLSDDGIVLMLCWDGKEPIRTLILNIFSCTQLFQYLIFKLVLGFLFVSFSLALSMDPIVNF